jgi:outer membrane protein assembly factor BamB
VFTATYQGEVFALDRATGAIVWSWAAPGGINSSPAAADDTILWPVGLADPPRLVALRLPR